MRKKQIMLLIIIASLIAVSSAFTNEKVLQIESNYDIQHLSGDRLCRDIYMENGIVYAVYPDQGRYILESTDLDSGSSVKTALVTDTQTNDSHIMLSVYKDTAYILDNELNTIFAFDLCGSLIGKYQIPEGDVVSFDTGEGKGYMQYKNGITLACYDFANKTIARAYRFEDDFAADHALSTVSVNNAKNTIRLGRISESFIIEDFDNFLNLTICKKTDVPFKPAAFDPATEKGDIIVSNIIFTEKYDFAARVSARDDGLFPVEVCRFKAGKKYPDLIYSLKGLENFKGYMKLLGIHNGSLVIFAHDENGSISRVLKNTGDKNDFIILSKKI